MYRGIEVQRSYFLLIKPPIQYALGFWWSFSYYEDVDNCLQFFALVCLIIRLGVLF